MELKDFTKLDISKPRIAFYGLTGAGKSSTLNTLMGKKLAQTSPSATSCTDKPYLYKGYWINTNSQFYAIDLCGHNDSNGRDEQQTIEMVSKIKVVNYINAFFIVINS